MEKCIQTRKHKTLRWVGKQSKTTGDQRGEDNCMQNGQLRTSCCSRLIHQFWKQFVVNIDMSTSPAQERSDDRAAGNCGDSPKKKNKQKKRDNNQASGNRLLDLLEWWEEFTENLDDTQAPAPAHVSQDSDSERPTKWQRNQGSTVFILTSRRTELAKSASEPKSQGLLAKDALGKQYIGQKSLVTWQRLITKSSSRKVNLETITGTLSWYKILPLEDFTGDGEEFTKVPRAVTQGKTNSHRQFTGIWQILWRSIMESSNFYTSCFLHVQWENVMGQEHRHDNGLRKRTGHARHASVSLGQTHHQVTWWWCSCCCHGANGRSSTTRVKSLLFRKIVNIMCEWSHNYDESEWSLMTSLFRRLGFS